MHRCIQQIGIIAINLEVKAKWIAALRSGEYKQGRGKLRDRDNNYCCLGVLCDIHAKETGNTWDSYELYLGCNSALPKVVRHYAGLKSSNPDIIKIDTSLTQLNDIYKKSFLEIADIIEKYL